MAEIKCPECGAVFKVDESCYDNIVRQIKDAEFQKEVKERIAQEKRVHEEQLKTLEEKNKSEKAKLTSEYEQKLETVRRDDAEAKTKAVSELKEKNSQLQHKIDSDEQAKKLAIAEAIRQKTEEIANKNEEIQRLKSDFAEADQSCQRIGKKEFTASTRD